MIMEINGFPLPQHLINLISQGLWKCPADTKALRQLTGSKSSFDFEFLTLERMKSESILDRLVEDPKLAKIYGLASSTRSGKEITDTNLLDVDKAFFIALNWDEEAICLDYRLSRENPRIISTYQGGGQNANWKIIAPDIESFTTAIGLETGIST